MSRSLWPSELRNHVKAYPPPRHYSNPLVYQGIRRACVFGVAATGGSCGSSPQGGRRRGIVYVVANAVTFFRYPEICSIRDLNAGACPTVASGNALDRLWLWRAGPELNRQPPVVLQVCLPLSTSHPYCRSLPAATAYSAILCGLVPYIRACPCRCRSSLQGCPCPWSMLHIRVVRLCPNRPEG